MSKKELFHQVWIGIYAHKHGWKWEVPTPKSKDWHNAQVGEWGFNVVRDQNERIVGFGLNVRADADENQIVEAAEQAEEWVDQVQDLFNAWSFPHTAEVCMAPHFFS